MHGPVCAFGEHGVAHAVAQAFDDFIHRLAVVQHFLETVPHTGNGQDTQETQELVQDGFAENVRPRTEERCVLPVLQDDKCVHQRIAVVGGHDDRPVGRDVLPSFRIYLAEQAADRSVAPAF